MLNDACRRCVRGRPPGAPGHRAHGVGRDEVVPAVALPVHLVRAVADEVVDDRGPPLLLPVRLDALADREGVARLRLLALLRRGRRGGRRGALGRLGPADPLARLGVPLRALAPGARAARRLPEEPLARGLVPLRRVAGAVPLREPKGYLSFPRGIWRLEAAESFQASS